MGEDWQDDKTLSESNLHMLTHEIACDITFLVGEHEEAVLAHTFILNSRAAKLRKLYTDQKKFASKLVIIPDVTPEVFKLILRYFYAGHIDLTHQQALSLVPTVDTYGSQTLKKKCFELIVAGMTPDKVCEVLELCHKYADDFYLNKCLDFVYVNGNGVLMSRAWQQLCRECVETVIKSDELNADEHTVFKALISWADYQCSKRKLQPTDKNRRQMMGNMVFHTRFATMSLPEFTEKVSIKDILTSDEKIQIYQYHHGSRRKLPEHFVLTPRKIHTNRPEQKVAEIRNHKEAFTSTSANNARDDIEKDRNNLFAIEGISDVLKVVRFKSVNGTWKNNGPDAISFKCSHQIDLRGIQVFTSVHGTRGFNLEVAILDPHGCQIRRGIYHVASHESRLCEIVFTDPVRLPARQIFTIQTYSKGPPVYCGKDGVTSLFEGHVRFDFIASNKSLNGTDVTVGQIPVILFT